MTNTVKVLVYNNLIITAPTPLYRQWLGIKRLSNNNKKSDKVIGILFWRNISQVQSLLVAAEDVVHHVHEGLVLVRQIEYTPNGGTTD